MSARDFALLAQEAYSAKPDIGDADSASRAIVRDTAAGLVVAFRGSDNADSWLTDFDIETVDVPGAGKFHAGFWRAWQAIATDVLAAIDGRSVTLVGHSLGGALAIAAALDMTISGNPPVAVFGFEPPRVSPDMSARVALRRVDVRLYRTGLDIVPTVPLDWRHAAMLIRIGKPALPIPNVIDHEIGRVIAALAAVETVAA
ncbi:alpha/beta fold hydrolase [Paraburkholderia sp. T12-10]|nr:alpha/beta fold hydrolase [Paraburkholderia sp. T12-10]